MAPGGPPGNTLGFSVGLLFAFRDIRVGGSVGALVST